MDYYKTLGVERNASPEEIKKAYRKMAAQHHPDKGGDTATFQKIQEAYENLSDPQKRQQHDNPNPFGHGGNPFGFGPGGFQFHTQTFNMDDIFGQMFGQQRGHQSFRTTLWVTLEQVYKGEDQVIQFQAPGQQPQTVKIQIPKGIIDGGTLRYDNLVPNCVLLVEFRIHPHSKFERHGNNLQASQEISVLDLIVGTTFKFTTISGKTLDVTVKPKTQPGQLLKITGEGMPIHNRTGFGDQLILIKPIIPAIIDQTIVDAILKSQQS